MRRAIGLGFVTVAACLEPTQATLELSTNAPCGGAGPGAGTLYEAGILAGSRDQVRSGDLSGATTTCRAGGDIGTIVLFPHDGARDASAIAVGALGSRTAQECLEVAQGRRAGDLSDCIIARRQVAFVDNVNLRLPILLDNACAGVVCDEDATCARETDAQGNVVTKCVSAVVDCTADGTCDPTTVSSSTGEAGAGGQGGANQGGAGQGGGGTVGEITPLLLAIPPNTTARQVSGDLSGPVVAVLPTAVYRPGSTVPLLAFNGVTALSPTELIGAPAPMLLAFSDGSAAMGGAVYTETGTQVLDIAPESATTALVVLGGDLVPTIHRLTQSAGLWSHSIAISKATVPGSVTSLSGEGEIFAVGTRACFWAGGAGALDCVTPATGPLLDVWSSGFVAYAISGSAVVELTSGLAQTTFDVPLDPTVGAVTLRSVFGNLAGHTIWAGGRTSSARAYLVRQSTTTGARDEFVGPSLPGIEDVFVDASGTVYFVAGGKLYSFSPPPLP
jgi:hypothetical protein